MRKPLIAGNWKMNLNHLEAIAVTQKLAYSLEDRDYDAVEVVIIPPFTDIRSCLLYTSPSPRDGLLSRMPSSA